MFVSIWREGMAEVASRVVWSLLIIAVIAGMCVATLLTSGRTEAAESAALAQIDAEGTRTIVVRAAPEAGLESEVVTRVQRIVGIETVIGFGPIVDGRNGLVEGASLVPVRRVYGDLIRHTREGVAYASDAGATALGLHDGTGLIAMDGGRETVVVGSLDMPEYLASLEPLVVEPVDHANRDPVSLLIVLVSEPQDVAAVSIALADMLQLSDPSAVSIETSAQLASLRAAVGGELESYGRGTVLAILGVAGVLVVVSLLGLVQLRRRDFGRRRALGASRSLIVALVLVEVLLMGLVGAFVGTVGALATLGFSGASLPTPTFVASVATASVATGLVAALIPAVVASRREPLYELRVP